MKHAVQAPLRAGQNAPPAAHFDYRAHGIAVFRPGDAEQCSASGAGERVVDPCPQGGQRYGARLPGRHLTTA
jgi:hypothetical protein